MLKRKTAKCHEYLETASDLLDRIYRQAPDNPEFIAKRQQCKKNIKAINDRLKVAVAAGNAGKAEKLLAELEQAVIDLESTYSQD